MGDTTVDLPVLDRTSTPADWTEGIALLADKPAEWSSFRVIGLLRHLTGIRKIGHAGTLDPMATGLLICCIGRSATRQINRFVGMDKVYHGRIRLGEATPSLDAETSVSQRASVDHVTLESLRQATLPFHGSIEQKTPLYSAVKVKGKRLYSYARADAEVETPPRSVTIHRFEIVEFDGRDAVFEVACSKGTYVRSLAADLAAAVGSLGHLVSLRRVGIGPYAVENAVDILRLAQSTERRER